MRYTADPAIPARIGASTQPTLNFKTSNRLAANPVAIEARQVLKSAVTSVLIIVGPTNIDISPPVPIYAT